MRPKALLTILAFCLVAELGAPTPSAAGDALRPSDLNKNPEKYDRQSVVVEGILLVDLPGNDHLNAIYDSRIRMLWVDLKYKLGLGPSEKHPDKGCVSIDNRDFIWDNIKNPRYRHVRIKGQFIANYESAYDLISGTCAIGAGIWIEEILEVR